MWCGPCYRQHPLDRFYRHSPADEDGFEWQPPEDMNRHTHARDGDNLVTPFQCDLCTFRNMQLRNPIPGHAVDDYLLCCIRRVQLDALWGREPQTVLATLRSAKQMLKQWRIVGLTPHFPALGPYPVEDSFGVRVAIAMVLKSLEPGRYHAEYQQWETIRKLSAAHANIYGASLEGACSLRAVGGESVNSKLTLTRSPTYSLWSTRFKQGCLRRMGQDVRQDWAITLAAMNALVGAFERAWRGASEQREQRTIVMAGAFSVVGFCGSFRGNEVLLMDLFGLRKYLDQLADKDYVIVPLLGRFKGEAHARYHLQPIAAETNSGLRVRHWLQRLVAFQAREGLTHGPAFGDKHGKLVPSREIEGYIMDTLQALKDEEQSVIPPDLDCFEQFGISRSFRRGSTSTARTRGVDEKLVVLINRWRKFEQSKGKRPVMEMQDHYSGLEIIIPEIVKYSQAL